MNIIKEDFGVNEDFDNGDPDMIAAGFKYDNANGVYVKSVKIPALAYREMYIEIDLEDNTANICLKARTPSEKDMWLHTDAGVTGDNEEINFYWEPDLRAEITTQQFLEGLADYAENILRETGETLACSILGQ